MSNLIYIPGSTTTQEEGRKLSKRKVWDSSRNDRQMEKSN